MDDIFMEIPVWFTENYSTRYVRYCLLTILEKVNLRLIEKKSFCTLSFCARELLRAKLHIYGFKANSCGINADSQMLSEQKTEFMINLSYSCWREMSLGYYKDVSQNLYCPTFLYCNLYFIMNKTDFASYPSRQLHVES